MCLFHRHAGGGLYPTDHHFAHPEGRHAGDGVCRGVHHQDAGRQVHEVFRGPAAVAGCCQRLYRRTDQRPEGGQGLYPRGNLQKRV